MKGILFAVASLASLLPAQAAEVVLTPGNFEIVADVSDAGSEKYPGLVFAAQELRELLGEAFGAEIPVVSAPGGARKTISIEIDPTFARDDIRLVAGPGGVRIINGAARLYGVYEFLERYAGMRFYFPGPLGTIVPKRRELRVPFGTVDVKPDYTQRSCDMNWGKNGVWYAPGGDGDATPEEAATLLRQARARMRLAPRLMCCHGLVTMFHLKEKFGKTHPEYFALLKTPEGEFYRDDANSKWKGHSGHLCHMSGVWDEIYEMAKEKLLAGAPSVDVMAQDGMLRCLCDRCKNVYSADPSDPQFATDLIWGKTVELANKLSAAGVPGIVTQMAYHPYNRIPSIDIPTNLMVMVARYGPWSSGAKLERENAGVRAWAEKCGHRVWLWTYPGKFGKKMKNRDIPQMTPRAIGRYYASLSDAIFGSYHESRTDRWIYNYLNYYVYNKVSWNVKTDVDALLAEHDRLMFGAAAAEMRAYYDRLEEIWMGKVSGNVVETDEGPVVREPTEHQKWVDIYSPAVLAEFDGYLLRAAKNVPAGSIEAKRIAFIRRNFYDPMAAASAAYRAKTDVSSNEAARTGRPDRSILKGTWFGAPEEIVADGECPRNICYTQSLKGLVKPDTEYIVSYFVRQTNVVAKAKNGGTGVFVTDGKKGIFDPPAQERTGSRDWTYREFVWRTSSAPQDNAHVRMGFSKASGKAWFRGLRIEEKE